MNWQIKVPTVCLVIPAIILVLVLWYIVMYPLIHKWVHMLMFTEEETWCDGCKKFSRGRCCPYCDGEEKK